MDMLQLSRALATLVFIVAITNTAGKTQIVYPIKAHVYVQAGSTLTLTCEQEESRPVEWLKEGDKIDDSADSGLTIVNAVAGGMLTSNMTIEVANTSDSGTYVCQPVGVTTEGFNKVVTVFMLSGAPVELVKDRTAMLNCTVKGLGNEQPITWYKDDKVVSGERYKIYSADNTNTLEIISASEEDAGEYECRVKLASDETFMAVVHLQSKPYVKNFEKSKNIVEDDPLTLRCKAWAHPSPSISWYYEEKPVNMSDERVSLGANMDGQEDAVLKIQKLTEDDRGYYTCVASNDIGASNSTIFIRVKGRFAALWPFLGICAEVLILCIIIFIYEKKRSKSMEAEESREEADHLTNSHDHRANDDIRQRK